MTFAGASSRMFASVFALACGAATVADAQVQRQVQVTALTPTAARLLAAHNRERIAVGVSPLRWDPALEASATAYASTLAATGRLVHSPKAGRPGQSENLWVGPRGRYSPEQMVSRWGAERAYFRPGIFPHVSTTGRWLDVAHYTQLIWRTTTAVGCGIRSSGQLDYLVCRYSPKGNQDGRPVL